MATMTPMATEALVERLLAAATESAGTTMADAVHGLVDEAELAAAGTGLSVTEAARRVGLSAHTLRYYEQHDLVRPARNASGYREYGAEDLRRLVFLTRTAAMRDERYGG